MLLAQILESAFSASVPMMRNFANELWSKMATRSRTARCSSPTCVNQFCLPKEYTSCASAPSGANQLGRSQPSLEPKQAPCSFSFS